MPVIEYNCNPTVADFHMSERKIKALCGPMGSGKSVAVTMEFVRLCMESDISINGIVMRESHKQLHDSTRKTVEEWLGTFSHWKESEKTLYVTLPNYAGKEITHTLAFRHARREAEATSLLSTEYAFIWFEEPVPAFQNDLGGVIGAGLPEGMFSVAVGRLRQKGAPRKHIVLSFNPPSKFHWVYKQFFKPTAAELAKANMALFRQPAGENATNLDPDYYDTMRRIMSPELVARFVDGECRTVYPGKAVFPGFKENVHFREELEPIDGLPVIIGLDFGLTPACLFAQISAFGQLRVLKELQMYNASALDMAPQIMSVMRNEFSGLKLHHGWGDPAGKTKAQSDLSTAFDILRKELKVPIHEGAVAIRERQEAVNGRVNAMVGGEPGILIDSNRCGMLSEGLQGAYRYPKNADASISPVPLKNEYSHLADALQYLCAGEFSAVTGELTQREKAPEPWKRPEYNPLADEPETRSGTWMGR